MLENYKSTFDFLKFAHVYNYTQNNNGKPI